MKILMCASEAVPFAKSGGLADVVSALSKQLQLNGHDVRIVMPRYYSIDREKLKKHPNPLGVPVGFGEIWNAVYETTLPDSDVPVYFLDNEELYGRSGIYGENGSSSFPDNAKRFINLTRGSLQLCKMLDWYPDVVHSHDWPTSTAALFLNTWEKDGYFTKTASVLTIHNLGYQGWFPKDDIHLFQLQWEEFFASGLEKMDTLNFLKCGIMQSDVITTVSPTYAHEIQATMSEGLGSELSERSGDLYGVLNGMDYADWNPETDKLIPHNFSDKKMAGKAKMKAELQKRFGLEINPSKPLFGIVSRFAEQKGFGALCGPSHGSLFNICRDMDIQVVILGTGEKWCENELNELAGKTPNLAVHVGFNNELAHWIEAGSDFFLMPSQYEPCGLNQMYSLAYGTLPIVRRTGGLADTVENYNEETGDGTGFVFDELSPQAIYDVVGWATWAYYNKADHIKKMQKSAMSKKFLWEDSAKQYENIYQAAFAKRAQFRGLV